MSVSTLGIRSVPRAGHVLLAGMVILLVSPAPSPAAPVAGFTEHFTAAGDLGGFSGQATLSNPGTGGFDGSNDGFLRMSRQQFAAQLGARNSDAQYTGNWLAAGITHVELMLKDVDEDQNLEIHFCIGNVSNFWQYNIGFIPPGGAWGSFVVDLTDSTNFSHIIDSDGGSFAQALQETDRILVRHDQAPYAQFPDAILGEFGLDEIKLSSDPPVRTQTATWGAMKGLYR